MEEHKRHGLMILGSGVMGTGIAALGIGFGLMVTLVEVDKAKLDRAGRKVRQEMRLAQLMGALPEEREPGTLITTDSAEEGAHAAVVIEAVTETLESKAAALSHACALVEPGTPIVSNTSSIPIDELADSVARPEDLVGTHFMNPPYLIPTVEVIRGRRTGEAAEAALTAVLTELGRTSLVVADHPGFVTSRVLHPMINDAIRVVRRGTAPPETVDALFEGCLGHSTGPLRTADLIGLDNLADSLWVLHERTGDEGCRPDQLLLDKIREGHLGRKTGCGFYDYERNSS